MGAAAAALLAGALLVVACIAVVCQVCVFSGHTHHHPPLRAAAVAFPPPSTLLPFRTCEVTPTHETSTPPLAVASANTTTRHQDQHPPLGITGTGTAEAFRARVAAASHSGGRRARRVQGRRKGGGQAPAHARRGSPEADVVRQGLDSWQVIGPDLWQSGGQWLAGDAQHLGMDIARSCPSPHVANRTGSNVAHDPASGAHVAHDCPGPYAGYLDGGNTIRPGPSIDNRAGPYTTNRARPSTPRRPGPKCRDIWRCVVSKASCSRYACRAFPSHLTPGTSPTSAAADFYIIISLPQSLASPSLSSVSFLLVHSFCDSFPLSMSQSQALNPRP